MQSMPIRKLEKKANFFTINCDCICATCLKPVLRKLVNDPLNDLVNLCYSFKFMKLICLTKHMTQAVWHETVASIFICITFLNFRLRSFTLFSITTVHN